jgi:hypothetical protein
LFDPAFVKLTAQALGTDPSHVEKDWHVVRAIGTIASVQAPDVAPVFSGGTSLAAAWRIVNRFSEDIDFKVIIQATSPSAARARRSSFRKSVIDVMVAAGFTLDGDVLIGNESRFFRASFHYGPTLPPAAGIRPTLQIEMTFGGTLIEPILHPVQSLLSRAAPADPEVPSILCVQPVETAADKISALAWRTANRNRSLPNDDPTLVRHLHDLAALASVALRSPEFPALSRMLLATDATRVKPPGADGLTLLRAMLPTIAEDAQWRAEYEMFVQGVSFGPDAGRIGFDAAMAACGELVSRVIAS